MAALLPSLTLVAGDKVLLSDEQKESIRAEEIFREEVKDSLKSKGSPIWSFLNSSLGIWLLTTVIVTLGGTAVAEWSKRSASNAANEKRIEVLDIEIASRIFSAHVFFSNADYRRGDFERAYEILSGAAHPSPNWALPLPALLNELADRVPESEKFEVEAAFRESMKVALLEPKLVIVNPDFNPRFVGSQFEQPDGSDVFEYRLTWCRLIRTGRWAVFFEDETAKLHETCLEE